MNRLLLILVTIANNQYLCTYYLPITLLRFHTCNIMLRDDVFVWTMVFSLKKKTQHVYSWINMYAIMQNAHQ